MVECHQLVLAGPPETDAPDLSPEHLQPELKSKVHQYINWLLQVQLSAKSRSVFKDEGLPDETKPSKVARAFWQSTCLAVRKVGGTVPGCGQCILIAVVFCTYAWRTSLQLIERMPWLKKPHQKYLLHIFPFSKGS